MSFINQKKKLDFLLNEYPFMIIYGLERTTSLDGDYDEPNYFKTLSDAYYFLINSYKVKKYFNDKELDKNYDDYGYSCGNKSKIPTGNYYLLSIEKTEELYLDLQTDFKYVYKTPDDGIIYYAQILKSNINVICDGINLSNKKNLIQLSYFGLYKVSQDIQINNINTSIDYIDHMYPGKINIRLLKNNKYIADNEKSNNLKNIINNYLLRYDIPPIKSFDDFITKLQNSKIKYLEFDDFIINDLYPDVKIIFQELLINKNY